MVAGSAQCRQCDEDRIFRYPRKRKRSDQTGKQPTHHAAERQRDIEAREVLRRRSGSRQFAMTGHRDDDEAKQMAPQQNEQVSLAASGKQHDDAYNGKRLQQQHPSMGQQGAGLKHQYPGQEIYRKRKHPKQRRCGDVGRNVRGDRDKQAGWHRREEYPAPTRRPVYSWDGSAAGALERLMGRCAQQ